MLTDAQLQLLRDHADYKRCYASGYDGLLRDIVKSTDGELNPDFTTGIRVFRIFSKSRIVRRELVTSTSTLIESTLNQSIQWQYHPDSIKAICARKHDFHWMRFDEPRVQALFNFADHLLQDPRFRLAVKSKSHLSEADADHALNSIRTNLIVLGENTQRSIITRGLFDSFTNHRKDAYYKVNEDRIARIFLDSAHGTFLGPGQPTDTSKDDGPGQQLKEPPADGR